MKIHDMSGWTNEQWQQFRSLWNNALGMAFGPMPADAIDDMVSEVLSSPMTQIAGHHWEGWRYEDKHGASIWVMLVKDGEV